jgi:hypothetical protein
VANAVAIFNSKSNLATGIMVEIFTPISDYLYNSIAKSAANFMANNTVIVKFILLNITDN